MNEWTPPLCLIWDGMTPLPVPSLDKRRGCGKNKVHKILAAIRQIQLKKTVIQHLTDMLILWYVVLVLVTANCDIKSDEAQKLPNKQTVLLFTMGHWMFLISAGVVGQTGRRNGRWTLRRLVSRAHPITGVGVEVVEVVATTEEGEDGAQATEVWVMIQRCNTVLHTWWWWWWWSVGWCRLGYGSFSSDPL